MGIGTTDLELGLVIASSSLLLCKITLLLHLNAVIAAVMRAAVVWIVLVMRCDLVVGKMVRVGVVGVVVVIVVMVVAVVVVVVLVLV